MASTMQATLSCVAARDRYECMRLISDGQVDIANFNNEELYLAGRLYNLEAFAMEQVRGDTQSYQAVVLVSTKSNIKSIADLRGKRSCHGALNSTSGWDVPIGLLLATLTMTPDCRGELYTASRFFESSCAPERQHANLCSACHDPSTCSSDDEFYGDQGALKCLFSGRGDVAFTTLHAIERFLGPKRDPRLLEKYEYLCLDGTQQSLSTRVPCQWAVKPTNAFVTSPGRARHVKEQYLHVLQHLFFRYSLSKPAWWRMRSFISDQNDVTQIVPVPGGSGGTTSTNGQQQWDKYLGNYISSIEKPLPGCEPFNVTVCAASFSDQMQCLDLQKVAFSQRVRPEIDCKLAPSGHQECIDLLYRKSVDMFIANGVDMFEIPPEIRQFVETVAVSHPMFKCNAATDWPAKLILVPRYASKELKLAYRKISVWLSDKLSSDSPLRPYYDPQTTTFNSQLQLSQGNSISAAPMSSMRFKMILIGDHPLPSKPFKGYRIGNDFESHCPDGNYDRQAKEQAAELLQHLCQQLLFAQENPDLLTQRERRREMAHVSRDWSEFMGHHDLCQPESTVDYGGDLGYSQQRQTVVTGPTSKRGL
ncbi:hypothetical protein GZH46_01567, partial [Fragariocoptes setiger]